MSVAICSFCKYKIRRYKMSVNYNRGWGAENNEHENDGTATGSV